MKDHGRPVRLDALAPYTYGPACAWPWMRGQERPRVAALRWATRTVCTVNTNSHRRRLGTHHRCRHGSTWTAALCHHLFRFKGQLGAAAGR